MMRTEPALYEVVGRKNNHLWLEVLEGDDQGLRVSVPVHDAAYDSEDNSENLESRIRNLSVGDVGRFILESEDEGRPDWRIHKICEIKGDRDPILA